MKRHHWVVIAGVVAAGALVGAGPANAAPSEGCTLINGPSVDGVYNSAFAEPRSYMAGETILVTAGSPDSGLTSAISLRVGVDNPPPVVDTDGFPGSLTYTIPADGSYALGWAADVGNVTWSVSCTPLQADLSITKSAPESVAMGADIAYTLTITNTGPNDAAAVDLTDTLPAGVTFVSIEQNSGPTATITTPAIGASGTVTAELATLANAASATFTLTVNVAAPFTGDIDNTATVSSDTDDPDQTDNSATARTQVAPLADVAVTKTGPANSAPGSNVTYTIAVMNNGPNDATNVTLSDSLPADVTFVSSEQTSGPAPTTLDLGSDPGTATWATLASGATATFTLTVNVDDGFSGDLLNTAVVSADTTDPNPGNNTSTAALAVTTTTTTSTTTTTTTTVAPTTTTTLATTTSSSVPGTTTTTTTTTPTGILPPTGRGSSGISYVAALLVAGGLALIALTTRRRTSNV
jgi:uncharacterized repeat protein (TIGR01451 family)